MTFNKILICDDSENIRGSIKLILRHKPNLITIEADHGEKVLKILSEDSGINLVLLDLKLSGIDGLALTTIIKEKYPNIKIIIITGYEDEETKIKAYTLGVSGYIIKPFTTIEFLGIVETTLINDLPRGEPDA